MKCPKCQHENRASAKFCTKCRAKLQGVCPKCGTEFSPEDIFCSECGAEFATLLSIPLGEGYSPLSLTPQQQKQKTLQAMLTMLLHQASQQPVLLVVEDLHWSDPSTLEFLNLISCA